MEFWWIPWVVLLGVAAILLGVSWVCFFLIFYSAKRKPPKKQECPTPEGKVYDPHRAQMVEWIRWARQLDCREVSITSFDGLRLCGKYYEHQKGAPIEILFHGYRGTAERDLSGGVYRCFSLGRNALIVDHRASGRSEGRVITFGVKESLDCLAWVDFAVAEIDKDAKIILTGISMGAATVMTAASLPLPPNVVGILADCGYTSTEQIVKKVMRDMHLPARLLYLFAKLGARIFGRFDPDEASPIKSMPLCSLPIIFFHGDGDDFVPCSMSEENFAACASEHKRLVVTPKAGHGLCFPADQKTYFAELESFFAPYL